MFYVQMSYYNANTAGFSTTKLNYNKSVVWQTGLKHTIDMKQLGWDAGFLPVTLLII